MIKQRKNVEKGFALPLTLLLLVVMSLMGTILVSKTTSEHSANTTKDLSQQSFYAAESGITAAKNWMVSDAGQDLLKNSSPSNIDRDLKAIKKRGVKCGLAIKPSTDEMVLKKYVDILDYVLVMSVEPGFGGQEFIHSTLDKMRNIVEMRGDRKILIGVDGGVNVNTISSVYDTCIDIVVVGSGLYKAEDIEERYNQLMNV